MLYKSFGIVRTNVGLTTNVKLIVDSKYKLYLDSIDSNNDLSLSRFKKFAVNKKDRYDRLIPNFYKNFPSDLAFDIKYDNDVDSMKNNFRFQHDETYQYGARNIINNKSYSEEFEYFAPIYIFPDNLPNSFIIFRVDGTGLDVINKDNFQSNIVKKFKTIKRFDLTKQTPIGEWLDINYTKNESFPISPLDIDFKRNEFSKWNGIDYNTGGYTSKSLFLEEWFSEEKEIFETEKFIFDGYKNNKIVFPNILNLSFLFDDTPSTPDVKRKWSINRYYGFYFDSVEHITSVFPTKTKQLKQNVSIDQNNLLISESGYPFLDAWNDSINNYIEISGIFYKVVRLKNTKKPELPSDIIDDLQDDVVIIDLNNKTERTNINSAFIEEFLDDTVYSYKIISDKPLSSFINDVNKNIGFTIDSDNILRINGSTYSISGFDDADIWLIEINNILHNLVKESETIKVFTDYSFNFDPTSNSYSYKVGGLETKINLIKNNQQEPEEFKIYRLKFTDIKDFDTRIVDTEPSKFEYELENKLTETDESKMYLTDLNSDTNPKEIDTFIIDEKLVNIPVSSEYTANYETFKITESGLTELWRKNSTYCRFGFQKSLSANDFPYVLNNSLLFEDFNRTTNLFEPSPKRIERNLDYFYTINSDSSDYVHHSLHIEDNNLDFTINKNFRFEIEKYLDPNGYDYFSEFFNRRSNFLNGSIIKNTIKYSYFNKGDKSIPNITLFRGIKFLIYDVEDIKKNLNNQLDVINLKTSNSFQDYKFSILLSDNKEYDSVQRIVDYSTTSCEVPTVYYLTSGLTYSYSDFYTVQNRRYYIDSNGNDQDVLIGKYILLSDDMVSPNIATPSYHETDNCKHKVLYKINDYGYDSDVDSFYINLVDSEDNQITDPNYLPNSLGTFSFISSLNDYPYMMIGTNSGIYLGNTFSIGTYSVSVTESGYFEEDQYIKITDSNNNDINVIYGNGVTGSIYIDTLVSENDMNWKIIENWEMDKTYPPNSYVLYDDVIYRSLKSITTTQPTMGDKKSSPYNIDGWKNETVFGSPFLDFEKNYDLNDFVFNSGDYYKKIYVGEDINGDFWKPKTTYYKNNIVLYKGKYYESLIDNNIGYSPFEKNWKEIDSKDLMWSKIQLWNPSKSYLSSSLVIHNEIVYLSNQTIDSNEEPGFSDKWVRKYSLVADSDIQYESNNNPIIWFNNKYYLILSNTTDSNLENGIKIYVNKKWKNILINIEIKDNTTPNLKNVNRDELYIDLNKKLTASNFINSLNDISNRYDFIDYLKYIIIDENGEKLEYDYNNIEGLPCLINCEFPDDLSVKVDSLNIETIDLKNDLIPKQVLKDNVLGNSNQINYYNGNPIAVRIIENKNEPKTFSNYNSNDNIVANLLYRFSGFYMPIFYDIDLFDKNGYRFDTDLTYFGIMLEKKISKINRNGSVLKLKDKTNIRSIYPMLDEFGYDFTDFFIFKGTFDYNYYIETNR